MIQIKDAPVFTSREASSNYVTLLSLKTFAIFAMVMLPLIIYQIDPIDHTEQNFRLNFIHLRIQHPSRLAVCENGGLPEFYLFIRTMFLLFMFLFFIKVRCCFYTARVHNPAA